MTIIELLHDKERKLKTVREKNQVTYNIKINPLK
jgi:hypothetical protein